jgi:DNA-binding MarR family transcriptional regulator
MSPDRTPTPSAVTKTEYELLAAFRYALRLFFRFSEDAARKVGLSPRQYQAMLAIMGLPERDKLTLGELAEQLQIKHHSAVGLVNRLVTQKLVVRQPDTRDRRQVYVRLTQRGEEMLNRLATVHSEELSRIGPKLNEILGRLTTDKSESA